MSNRQINRILKAFDKSRSEWIEILAKNPNNSNACHMIIQINAKMEVYRGMWNWFDTIEEMVDY